MDNLKICEIVEVYDGVAFPAPTLKICRKFHRKSSTHEKDNLQPPPPPIGADEWRVDKNIILFFLVSDESNSEIDVGKKKKRVHSMELTDLPIVLLLKDTIALYQ